MTSPLVDLFSDLGIVFKQTSSEWYVFGAQAPRLCLLIRSSSCSRPRLNASLSVAFEMNLCG